LDYATLDRRANALAWQLREEGVIEGQVVAVMLERNADWPLALLGVLMAGAVYLPLDLRHPAARRRELLRQSDAKALIAAAADLDVFADTGLHLLTPPVETFADAPPLAITSSDPAYLIYTSGSTGVPKGVLVQHRAFVNMILAQIRGFALTPDDTVLQLASCAFDASLSELFMAWLSGACVAIADHASARDSALLAQAIAGYGATVATFTPSHLRQLDDSDLTGLRKVILAAEAVLGRDARRLLALGIDCFNAYGPTETAVCATLTRITKVNDDAAPVPIGRPLDNLTLRIVDAAGRDAPLGVAGEIQVLGEGVALGYLHQPENAESPFFTLDNGLRGYRTGDLGRWLADGNIEYLHRKDAQLKIRGHRVEPGEIATALTAVAGIRQAEVIAEQGPAGVFLIACLCGERQTDAALRARLSDTLPPHMLPARFVWLERMPLTTSGKLDRAALTALLPTIDTAQAAPAAPLNDLEQTLLTLWRDMLPGDIDADTDFFAAGGNSLLAMSSARRIAQHLGRSCPALQFFKTTTVRSMAAALNATDEDDALLHTFGNGPQAVFALPPDPALGLAYAQLSRAMPELSIHALRFADKPLDDLIASYADAIASLKPANEALILGYSAGGKLALALAQTLEQRGIPARAVVLIDTWHWSRATPEIRHRINREMNEALPQAAATPLSAAYRVRMEDFEPTGMVNTPLHHLMATLDTAPPDGVSRDWSRLAGAGYWEQTLKGNHHQLLDAAHVGQAVECLRGVMSSSTGSSWSETAAHIGPGER
ncbi:MAG TPA: amino acid adenylation domain-containing protein, partial [Noviherbaspirillum sp.]|nr:amino acid adenylation domain-containing protein [Noviherbaspirillum sp.]